MLLLLLKLEAFCRVTLLTSLTRNANGGGMYMSSATCLHSAGWLNNVQGFRPAAAAGCAASGGRPAAARRCRETGRGETTALQTWAQDAFTFMHLILPSAHSHGKQYLCAWRL